MDGVSLTLHHPSSAGCAERRSQKGSGSPKSLTHENRSSSGECGRMSLQLLPVSSGWCVSADIRYSGSDECQDLDTFCHSAIDLPLLYPGGGGEIIRFQGVYLDSVVLLSTGTDDCAPRAGVRSFTRYAPVHCAIPPNESRRLIKDKT